MEFGVGLKGVMERHEKGEVPNGLQHTALCECVFQHFLLAYHRLLFEHLHGIQLGLTARLTAGVCHAD